MGFLCDDYIQVKIHFIKEFKMEGKYIIGIRCEDKSVWERRAPLSPANMKQILAEHPEITFIVQPSKKRIFSDYQYASHGAIVQDDLSQCQLIVGIKEIPPEKLIGDKTYMYFSHTIKAQAHNMPALDTILQKNIRLIDYEKIADPQNNRLIAFGKYAGIAGAIDFLKGFGEYVMQMGISTPFLSCNCAYKYFQVKQCYNHLKQIGKKIVEKQIPKQLCPMIFAITGRGRTAQGCLQVLQNLPITKINPSDIPALINDPQNKAHRSTIYLVNINTEDCMVPLDPSLSFNKEDFYKNPSKYRSVFKEKYLPYISVLLHCIFWDPKYPKYIKKKHLLKLANEKRLRLIGVCDVTCDLDGSIQVLQEYTFPQKPFFYYDSLKQEQTYDQAYTYGKILYSAMDFLPCELAFDASNYFSSILKKWMIPIVKSDQNQPIEEQNLPPEIQKAIISCHGKLTPLFQYIAKMREENKFKAIANTMAKKKESINVEIDLTNSMFHKNVTIIQKDKIQGEALDFSN